MDEKRINNIKIGDLVRITDNKFPIKKFFNKIGIVTEVGKHAKIVLLNEKEHIFFISELEKVEI